jgi:hypothetical protein
LNYQEGVMGTYRGTDTVKGGYYFDLEDWKLEVVDGTIGTLPRDRRSRYVRIPTLALLAMAPLLGLAFVVLLPFLGLAVVAEHVWEKLTAAVRAHHARQAPQVTHPRR